jgi:endonuclease/exonuclease/phosphatase family metal-dependent hydrolase
MDRDRVRRLVLLVVLVFLFTVESVRVHVASLGWYQRDTLGVGALDLVPVALVPFAAAAVLPVLSKWVALRTVWWVGAVGLVGARVVTQVVGDPAIIHWSSGVGVAAGFGLLALASGLGRVPLVVGVVGGVTLDTAIKAQGVTLDLSYRPGVTPVIAVTLLAAGLVYLLAEQRPDGRRGAGWGSAATLAGLGPWLFVQYLVLQSAGWVSAMTGLPTVSVGIGLTLLNLAGLWLVTNLDAPPTIIAVAAAVVAAAAVLAEGPSVAFVMALVAAVPLAAVVWSAMVPEPDRDALAPAGTWLTVGAVLFLGVGFAYYLPIDMAIGITQSGARMVGAALLLLVGLASARRAGTAEASGFQVPAVWAAGPLVLAAAGLLGVGTLPAAPEIGPLRVMAYNIHQGFGTSGIMDVDAVAQVIIDSGATVVGVQEIARGGLLNAGTDLFTLLGERLGWEHSAHFGTNDPVWGNAILSRYPMGEVERVLLPLEGTPFRRGTISAPIATPIGEVIFISIHLQHINDSAVHAIDPEGDLYDVHRAQLGAALEAWAGRRPAVMVGDLNARPEWRQVVELGEAGWVDAWAEAGEGPGHTANAADPRYRIDYVLHTDDLTTVMAEVIDSQASDHFAVVAELERR